MIAWQLRVVWLSQDGYADSYSDFNSKAAAERAFYAVTRKDNRSLRKAELLYQGTIQKEHTYAV